MTTRERTIFVTACAGVVGLALMDSVWMGLSDLPCPRGVDDAFYKSPAAELVQTGRLTQPSVVGYLPRADEVFAAYPPLYQLAVAGWFALFGISTGASVAFGFVVHLLGMIGIMAVVAAALAEEPLPTTVRVLAVASAGVLFFGILRFFDRQEELAACFGWLESFLYLRGRLSGYRGAAISGTCIGLSGMVSPWTGLVFAALIVAREALAVMGVGRLSESANVGRLSESAAATELEHKSDSGPSRLGESAYANQSRLGESAHADQSRLGAATRAAGRMAFAGMVAIIPVAVWLGWLEWKHPHVIRDQFLYHVAVSEKATIFESPGKAWDTLRHSPYQLPALLFTLLFFPRLLAPTRRRTVPTGTFALFGAGVASFFFALVLRTNSYNYVWLSLFLWIPCFGYLAGRLIAEAPPRERVFPMVMVLVVAAVSLRDPVSLSLIARDLPAEERPEAIFARLEEQIPPGEMVATTSRYWYLFQGRNPWRITAIYSRLDEQHRREWQWLVLPAEYATEAERAHLTRGFRLVDQVPSTYRTFAPTFQVEDRTWAYDLYRRVDDKSVGK